MKTHTAIPQAAPKIVVRSLSAHSPRGVLTYGSLSFPCALGPQRAAGRQARGRRRNAARHFRAAAGVLSAGPAAAAADAACRCRRSARPTAGAMPPKIATTTVRSSIPIRPAPSTCGGRTGSTIVVVVMGYNDRPRIAGRGSAVFMHVAGAGSEADRGMHCAGATASPPAAAGGLAAAPSSASRPDTHRTPQKNGPKCRSTGPSLEHA